MFAFASNVHSFEMTHFWVNVFEEVAERFALGFKRCVENHVVVFEAMMIGRKLMIRVLTVFS